MLINSLGLKNFKCFEELDVTFAPITLLTGANSSGKSSLINAILAVLQTEGFPYILSPNGQYVNLGSFEEMVRANNKRNNFEINIDIAKSYGLQNELKKNKISVKSSWQLVHDDGLPYLNSLLVERDTFRLSLKDEGDFYKVKFKTEITPYRSLKEMQEKLLCIDGVIGSFSENIKDKSYEIEDLILRGDMHPVDIADEIDYVTRNGIDDYFFELKYNDKFDFNYIGSFRHSPARTYYRQAKSDFKLEVSGEGYVDQIIEWEESESDEYNSLIKITRQLGLFEDIKSSKFKSGRFELNVKTHKKAKRASLVDVGFGVSQFLPIVVADLQLSNKSCLAISQPEIHLHPKIQAQFGNYLVNQIRQTQKQYIVETHSEYLLNRIRLLLTTGELNPEDVQVLYFENDGVKSTVHNVEFTTDGQIKGAPAGFFDTYGIDVMDIAMNAH